MVAVVTTVVRGKAGKLHVNFKTNATYSYSPRMPEYADAYQYAKHWRILKRALFVETTRYILLLN